jgi:hypothetical protein
VGWTLTNEPSQTSVRKLDAYQPSLFPRSISLFGRI